MLPLKTFVSSVNVPSPTTVFYTSSSQFTEGAPGYIWSISPAVKGTLGPKKMEVLAACRCRGWETSSFLS